MQKQLDLASAIAGVASIPHCFERNRNQRSVTLKHNFQAHMLRAILLRDQKTSVNSQF